MTEGGQDPVPEAVKADSGGDESAGGDGHESGPAPNLEPALRDIETVLLKENRSLRRAVEAFYYLAETRWTKHAKLSSADFAKKITPALASIKSALMRTKDALRASDELRERMWDEMRTFVLGKVLPKWMSKEMTDKDKLFAARSDDAFALLDPDYMHVDERIVQNPAFVESARLIKQIEIVPAPEMKVQIIDQCRTNLENIMKEYDIEPKQGLMTSAFVLLLSQARLRCLPSTLTFIDDFSSTEDRAQPSFASYTQVCSACAYLFDFVPNSHIVRCSLFSEDVPEALSERIEAAEYNEILQPVRELVGGVKGGTVRATGATVGAAIGAAVVAPLAVIVGVATIGLGAPISAGVLAGGAALGTALGAALPLKSRKQFNALKEKISAINSQLETRGFTIVDPVLTNAIVATSTINDVQEIEWMIRYIIPHSVQPEVPTESEWSGFPIPPDAPQKEVHRLKAANEIVQTEISFAKDLTFLLVQYARPLKENPHGLSEEEYEKLFNDLEPIAAVSRELIRRLKTGGDRKIGESFLALAEFLKCYKTFCARHQTRADMLKSILTRNSDFNTFVLEVKKLPESRHLHLEDFLMTPVQRLCRYSLLLRELKKYTEDDRQVQELDLAMKKIDAIVDEINVSTRGIENQYAIQELSQRFQNYADYAPQHGELITPSRRLVKEGNVHIIMTCVTSAEKKEDLPTGSLGSLSSSLSSSMRSSFSHPTGTELILFNDVLLMVRVYSSGKLKITDWLNLNEVLLDDSVLLPDGAEEGSDERAKTFAILRPADSTVIMMEDTDNVGWQDMIAAIVPKRSAVESEECFVADNSSINETGMLFGDACATYCPGDRTRYQVVGKTKYGVVKCPVLRSGGGFICPTAKYLLDVKGSAIVFESRL